MGEAADEEAERMGRTTQANVFQRRPCRPVSAWGMNKTETEGIESRPHAQPEKQAPPTEAAASAKGAHAAEKIVNGTAGTPKEFAPKMRVDRRAFRDLHLYWLRCQNAALVSSLPRGL